MPVLLDFDTNSVESYRQFKAVRRLPNYRFKGSRAVVPDEYAHMIGVQPSASCELKYHPSSFLFDYQRDIAKLAIRKRRFAIFADCGFGKWLMICEYARHAMESTGKRVLIVMPKLCIPQQISETEKFYGDELQAEQILSGKVSEWLSKSGPAIGLTNYEAFKNDIKPGNIGALILDESSTLASQYGKYAKACIELGRGLEWKLSATGTPAPNDRVEYSAQAVFLDQCRTVNEFMARYFINRGQTQNRWELKPHGFKPFYRDLSHWSIFLSDPSVYGWQDNCNTIPPIRVHVDRVELTDEQRAIVQKLTGGMFVKNAGGVGMRSKLGQIAKGIGSHGKDIATNKPGFIKSLVDSWPDHSTLIWCKYNPEQEQMERTFPDAGSVAGSTPDDKRVEIIDQFKRRETRTLISKPEIMGYGLNLQVCTKMVFSGLEDSYLKFYQAVKRANRVGSTEPLDVHIPVTEIEEPMVQNVLSKSARVQEDTEEQQRLFKELGHVEL